MIIQAERQVQQFFSRIPVDFIVEPRPAVTLINVKITLEAILVIKLTLRGKQQNSRICY